MNSKKYYALCIGAVASIIVYGSGYTQSVPENTTPNVVVEEAKAFEEKKEKKNVFRTDEVVISATKIDKELQDVPVTVSIITQEDIERSNAKTVGDALRDIAGVELTSDGTQGLKRISIRGEKVSGTLILIDGQRIVENKSVDGAPILIDPSRIERIEVIKGPASVLYGADAMGGVINIITKKGGEKPIQGEVFVGYNGSTNGFNEGLSLYGATNGFTYRASIAHSDQGNLRTPKGVMENTYYNNTDANLYLDYTFDKYTVGINYDYYHANIRGTIELLALDGTRYDAFQANMPSWDRHKINTFFIARDITNTLRKVRMDIFAQENTKDFDNIVKPTASPVTTRTASINKNQQIGATLQTDWFFAGNTIVVAGYDFEYDRLTTESIQGTYYKVKGYTVSNALYAQGETAVPSDIAIIYGTRLSVISTGIDSHIGSTVTNAKDKTYVYPVFNLGVTWSGLENTTFRALATQGFRSPNLQERYIDTRGTGIIKANANLKPEKSHTAELGVRYFANNLSIDVTTFYTFTQDYIVANPIPAAGFVPTFEYTNVGKVHTFGIEGDIRYTIDAIDITPYTTVAFIQRELDYGTFSTWKSGTPAFSGRFGLLYEKDMPEDGFTVYVDGYGKYASSTTLVQPKNVTTTQTLKVDAFITANINAGVQFGKERQYYAQVIAENLFNTTYISPSAVRQIGAGYIYEPGLFAGFQLGARF